MKIRTGFVTNSSSTSFICDVCGYIESGYDLSFRDAGFCMCTHGHQFCERHLKESEELNSFIQDFENNKKFSWDEWQEAIPEEFCPICKLESISDADFVKYMSTKGITKKEVLSEIKQLFETREKFDEYLMEQQKNG